MLALGGATSFLSDWPEDGPAIVRRLYVGDKSQLIRVMLTALAVRDNVVGRG